MATQRKKEIPFKVISFIKWQPELQPESPEERDEGKKMKE